MAEANVADLSAVKRLRESAHNLMAHGWGNPEQQASAGPEERAALRTFFEAVYDVVHEALQSTACSPRFQIARSSQQQEDAIHEALIRTFRAALRVCQSGKVRWEESDETLKHFFGKVARRELGKERGKLLDRLRRLRGAIPLTEGHLSIDDPSPDDMERDELHEILHTLVADDTDREIIRMRIDNAPFKDIAGYLARRGFRATVSTIRQRYSRARKDLQARLARRESQHPS